MTLQNVSEIYPLHDTVVISQRLVGNEPNVKGWFGAHAGQPGNRPFQLFRDQGIHTFFKDRTKGNCDPAYCNLESAETMDFGYRVYSIGVRFWGPPTGFEVSPLWSGEYPPPWGDIAQDDPVMVASCLSAWWKGSFPLQCAFRFKVEQDVILEGPAGTFPPGHGVAGTGAVWSDPVTPDNSADWPPAAPDVGDLLILQHPQLISVITQNDPVFGTRFNFVDANNRPQPIEIPKGALYKAEIELSDYATYYLDQQAGPLYYLFNRRCPRTWQSGEATFDHDLAYWIGTRYGVTVSLLGERLVQRRGQYWAPGYSAGDAGAEE